ncbi:MerR family transcriptional regulator [Erysipelothrix sp. HDW6C]|uniref:MerR family transcriptional regulator n=1 Tax=Erysipelothrix sp. HDW6C TaxID=2714930 RepID=UPI00140891D9|nr:MerR family transcriptional regulator [Erysipelothrix sp. HDW6C]QIK69114.1 MerR family transcriptional regulator [Erysipelothrix sp. HDW6C]
MKIAEVSELVGLSTDTLRYYEKIDLISTVKKINGQRDYSEADVARITFVRNLRNAGMSIASLKRYLQLVYQGDATSQERKEILIEERNRILEATIALIDTVDLLNYKIDAYEEKIIVRENELRESRERNE